MKVLATILVLMTSIFGFICSYDFAYKKIASILKSDQPKSEMVVTARAK
ncbi:MAG: hypothetical protein HQM10_14140 [Candidatus Riflebacteria bacterium]|nr:hypothetical protein [Candidatus Riflebacteria bacterium]